MRSHAWPPARHLAVLLVVAAALLFVPATQNLQLRAQALSALRPLHELFASGGDAPTAASAQRGDAASPADEAELRRMRERYTHLQHEYLRLREEFNRQCTLAGAGPVRDGASPPRGVAAHVIARQGEAGAAILGIDRGTQDGLAPGAGVLCRGAVAGKVVTAAARASCVAPLTHPGVAIAARLANCRAEGIVGGSEDADTEARCRMKVVARELPVRPGEWVVTSGLDGCFPPGCPIGKVVRAERQDDLEWSVEIQPVLRAEQLEAVWVLQAEAIAVPWP